MIRIATLFFLIVLCLLTSSSCKTATTEALAVTTNAQQKFSIENIASNVSADLEYVDGKKIADKNGGIAVIEKEFELVNNTDMAQEFKFLKSSAIKLNPVAGKVEPKGKLKVKLKFLLHTFDNSERYGAVFLESDASDQPRIELRARWKSPFYAVENDEKSLIKYSSSKETWVDLHAAFEKMEQADVEVTTDKSWLKTEIVEKDKVAFLKLTADDSDYGPVAIQLRHKPTNYKDKILFIYQKRQKAKLVPAVVFQHPVKKSFSKFAIVLDAFDGDSIREHVQSSEGKIVVLAERKLGSQFVAECQIELEQSKDRASITVKGHRPMDLEIQNLAANEGMEKAWTPNGNYAVKDLSRNLYKIQTALFNQRTVFQASNEYGAGMAKDFKKGKGAISIKTVRTWNVHRRANGDLIESKSVEFNQDNGTKKTNRSARMVIDQKHALYPLGKVVAEHRVLDRLVANPYFESLNKPFFSNSVFELLANVCFDVSIEWQPIQFVAPKGELKMQLNGKVTVRNEKEPSYTIRLEFDPENYLALKSCEIRFAKDNRMISRTEVAEAMKSIGSFGLTKRATRQTFDEHSRATTIRHFGVSKIEWPSREDFWADVKRIDEKGLFDQK